MPQSRSLSSTVARARRDSRAQAPPPPDQPPPTDFSQLDVLGDIPAPATSVDVCTWDGFHLNSGIKVLDGNGVILVGGEAFVWRPWLVAGSSKRLVNAKGQWDVPAEAFGLLSVLWPRPGMSFVFVLLGAACMDFGVVEWQWQS